MASSEGKIVQVIGPVVDIDFEDGYLPEIYNAISINRTTLKFSSIWVKIELELLLWIPQTD